MSPAVYTNSSAPEIPTLSNAIGRIESGSVTQTAVRCSSALELAVLAATFGIVIYQLEGKEPLSARGWAAIEPEDRGWNSGAPGGAARTGPGCPGSSRSGGSAKRGAAPPG